VCDTFYTLIRYYYY